jgi:hypothetical protein
MNKELIEKLIEYFESRADADGDSEGMYPNEEMRLLTELVKLQPKAVDKEREWISVENRLPNNSEHDWVLAFIQEDNGYKWIPKVCEYRQNINDWYCQATGWMSSNDGTIFVTHWMPLPEPPKNTNK